MSKYLVLVWVAVLTLVLVGPVVLPAYGDVAWEVQVVDEKAELLGISLALDSHGQPHMIYAATPSGNSFSHPTPEYLTYASWNGSNWNTQIVVENGHIYYSALAFDLNNKPHIAYSTPDSNATSSQTPHHFMNYATWNTTHWSTTRVDSGVRGSIVVDSKGNPHIAYADNNGLLKYASWTGSNWEIQVVDSDFLRPQNSNGEVTASQFLTLDATDNPCIVYGDGSTVKVATASPSNWNIQTVCSGEPLKLGNVAMDSHGYPRFTYVTTLNRSVVYESWNGSVWITQIVSDKAADEFSPSFVKLDSRDIPYITYISVPLATVYYVAWNGTGWNAQIVDQSSYISYCAPFALDSEDNPHICYLIGRGTGDSERFWADGTVKYATSNQPTPTPSPTVPELTPWIALPFFAVTATAVLFVKRLGKRITQIQR